MLPDAPPPDKKDAWVDPAATHEDIWGIQETGEEQFCPMTVWCKTEHARSCKLRDSQLSWRGYTSGRLGISKGVGRGGLENTVTEHTT